jgi:hypothetical protein
MLEGIVLSIISGVLIFFFLWVKTRVSDGYLALKLESKTVDDLHRVIDSLKHQNSSLEQELIDLRRCRDRCVEVERNTAQYWQNKYIELMEANDGKDNG